MVEEMDLTAFQTDFPGRLVKTAFQEQRAGRLVTTSGWAFVPDALPPTRIDRTTFIGRLFDVLDWAKSNLVRLDAAVENLPDPKILLSALRLREAQASSRIENTFASMRELALADAAGRHARDEVLEVHRNRMAIEAGLTSVLPIGRALICQMHAVLIADPKKRPGQLRDVQVCIGDEKRPFDEARFVPPPPIHLAECVESWDRFVRAENAEPNDRWPDLIEMAFGHYQFETIHPFSDGNGRLGRAIINLQPVRNGSLKHPVCNLSEWVNRHRQDYYDRLLRVSTHGDWEGWTRFFCTAIAEQATLDLARVRAIAELRKRYHELVTTKHRSTVLLRLVDRLFIHPATSISGAAENLGVSYTTAQKHVKVLLEHRVLTPYGPGTYGKMFLADDIINAIEGVSDDA